MKVFAVVTVLVTLVAPVVARLTPQTVATQEIDAKDSFVTEDTSSDAIVFSSEAKPIKSLQALTKTGFVVEALDTGAEEALSKAIANGDLVFEVYEDAAINANLKVTQLGSDQVAVQQVQQEIDALEQDQTRRLVQRRCPELLASGISNNVVLTITLRFFGFNFHISVSCQEQCCARMWECNHGRCKLLCQGGRILQVRTFSPNVCCHLNGRETDLPIGNCFDTLLCSA